jgi:hypothetical protein
MEMMFFCLVVHFNTDAQVSQCFARWKDNIKMYLKQNMRVWTDIVVGSCKHGNEPLNSMRGGEFLD